MRLEIVEDDDKLDMEEIEGLVQPASSYATKRPKGKNLKGKVEASLRYQSRIQAMLLLLAFVAVFFIGMEFGSDTGVEKKILAGEKEVKNETFVDDDAVLTESEENGEEMKDDDEEEEAEEEEEEEEEEVIKETEAPKDPTAQPTPSPTKAPKLYSTHSIDVEKWGKWKFYDGEKDTRPAGDYCAEFPNRDIPAEKFPENAWQTDAVYVNHFINEGLNLVKRVQEAILTEYGHGEVEGMTAEEQVERRKMFELNFFGPEERVGTNTNAGGTTKESFDGLARRLLHAMMTNDSFSIVMGGHSAAAGHGNHFKQSYMMQLYHVLEPVFDRLGMDLTVGNFGRGGLGTIQDSFGMRSMYGEELDIVMWDSGMTEPAAPEIDLFYRQALMGNRAPVLFCNGNAAVHIFHEYRNKTGADILILGSGMSGIPLTMDEEQVKTLPYATRFMACDPKRGDLCGNAANKYRTKCWIERDDVTPPTGQQPYAPSQVSWHPGFRVHKLVGRVMAYIILEALQDALTIWSEHTITAGHPLKDEFWHVTPKYNDIHKKLENFTFECEAKDPPTYPQRVCKLHMYARSEFTPRIDPNSTSIYSILKLPSDNHMKDFLFPELYHGPDVYNPAIEIPEGEIDVRAIAGARRLTSVHTNQPNTQNPLRQRNVDTTKTFSLIKDPRYLDDEIRPGLGWMLTSDIPPGSCDGTYYSTCGRTSTSNCLLSGHADHRGGIVGNSFSGWLVMNLPKVEKGFIMIKMETWHFPADIPITNGWTDVNNGNFTRNRKLKAQPPPLCDAFVFEFAINGKINSWNKEQFETNRFYSERVVEIFVLLDDENALDKKEDVEVAIRMRNCGTINTFSLTHIYWA